LPLDRGREEHRIGNERIVLRCDDRRRHDDAIQHVSCTRTIVVIGSVRIASVRSRVPIVKFTDAVDTFQTSQIPCAREQDRFSSQPSFQLSQKVAVINPVVRPLQFDDATGRIDVRTDGYCACQRRLICPHFSRRFQKKIATHGIADEPNAVQLLGLGQLTDHASVIRAEAAVIERRCQVFRPTAGALVHSDDVYTGRVPMLFNQDIIAYRCRPEKNFGKFEYYRNGGADEIIFVFKGGGTLESVFGKLRYRTEDYIVVPRGITYRLVPDKVEEEDYLVLESVGPVRIPRRYLNHEGQIRMGSPYSERDFHGPSELITIDSDKDVEILVKDGPRLTKVVNAHHPFDVVGWDGYVYPFTFNAQDFEPITGTVHQPPPIHQTFEIRGYVVCTFAPRVLDTHPEAVKIPWVHDNVEADEVLFYVRGNFGSRRGIEAGSITLHPRGIPHGPHPGTIVASKDALRTEELAVMFDTEHTLELTEQALKLDDEKYPLSWLD